MKRSGAKRSIGRGLARPGAGGALGRDPGGLCGERRLRGGGRGGPQQPLHHGAARPRGGAGPRGGADVQKGARRGAQDDGRPAGAFRLRFALEQGILFFRADQVCARNTRGHGQARGEERRAVVLGIGEGEPGPGRPQSLSQAVPGRRVRIPGAYPSQAALGAKGADAGRHGGGGICRSASSARSGGASRLR